jgi:hypothetical protein
MAAVVDHDAPVYARMPLVDHYADGPPACSQESNAVQPGNSFSGLSMLRMLSQLFAFRHRFRIIAAFRGLGIFILISVFEGIVALLSISLLPSLLAIFPQILLPLMLVQFYTLWTHTVLTHPSTKSLWQRIPPFKATFRATGPALTIFLAAKALTRLAVLQVRATKTYKWRGDLEPHFMAVQILAIAVVELVAVVPAHIVLTRVQASLLPVDEKPVAPIDEALRPEEKGDGREAVGIREAWKTFGWRARGRLAILYAQVGALVVFVGGLLLAVDFYMYIFVAFASWQF